MKLIKVKCCDGIKKYDHLYSLYQNRKYNDLKKNINKLSKKDFNTMIKYFRSKGFNEDNLQRAFFKYRQ